VEQAEQNLKSAELSLENATLKAPFAGLITAVNIVPGSNATATTAAFTIIDRSTLHVDVTLSENDVVQVREGQPVRLSIDSLDDWQAEGSVTYIAPAATVTNEVVTYEVRVSFPDDDPSVKVGMTADVNITTAEKRGVLLVPTTALLPSGATYVVEKPSLTGGTNEQVPVETGLSDETNTEITSGLREGDVIVELPNIGNDGPSGPFGGS
jgi:HlyD family secretion protein